jgi:hypothetical protein
VRTRWQVMSVAAVAAVGCLACGESSGTVDTDAKSAGVVLQLTPRDHVDEGGLTSAAIVVRDRLVRMRFADARVEVSGEALRVSVGRSDIDLERVARVVSTQTLLMFRPVLSVEPGKDALGQSGGGPTMTGATGIDSYSLLTPLTPDVEITLSKIVVLPQIVDGKEMRRYTLGPTTLTGNAVSGATAEDNADWQVSLELKSGQQGLEGFNELTAHCFNGDATCPTRQTAIVVAGRVVAAPVPQVAAFSTSTIVISGNFSESEARELAALLGAGDLPVAFSVLSETSVATTVAGR